MMQESKGKGKGFLKGGKGKFLIIGVVAIILAVVVLPMIKDGAKTSTNSAAPVATLTPFQQAQVDIASNKQTILTQGDDILELQKEVKALGDQDNTELIKAIADIQATVKTQAGTIVLLQTAVTALNSTGGIVSSVVIKPLTIETLGSIPVILQAGDYAFTVRITNTATIPALGRIVLQLHAYSGSTAVTNISISGEPVFGVAEYTPIQSAATGIMVYSDSILVGDSSSRIYQFVVHLDQAGLFQWVPTVSIAQ